MSQAISSKKNTQPTGCLIPFFSVFAIIGASSFIATFVLPMRNALRAQSWTPTTCVIQTSAVASRGTGEDLRYFPDVLYAYSFQGQNYSSNQWATFKVSRYNTSEVQNLINGFPVGAQRQCFVDPANPSQAVLDRAFPSEIVAGLFSLIFVAVGVGGIVWQVKTARAAKGNKAIGTAKWQPKPVLSSSQTFPSPTPTEGSTPSGGVGEIVLKPTATRAGSCLGIAIFSIIWNGFIGFAFWHLIFESRGAGFGRWFPILFLIPFVLVGILMLFATFTSFLTLFNSRVTLAMSAPQTMPGGSFELSWKMQRGIFNPRQLSLILEAREQATYTRGTDSITDKSVFYTQQFFQASSFAAMQNGRQTISIPEGMMHSFAAPHNKIIWSIKVDGPVTFGAAIKEEYEILVAPTP